jgi:class 3 adenylate cyclase
MKHINNFKIFEADESQNKSENPVRSERVLTQAQREYKDNPNLKSQGNLASMVFTDIVGSSKLWSDDPVTMVSQLEEHHKLIDSLAGKYNGWIVKTIGDAFMVYFEPSDKSLSNAINFSKQVIMSEKKYNLRVGVCQGPMDRKTYTLQNVELKDFYGNAVNVASRMESKVAGEGGVIAFSSTKELGENVLSVYKKMGKFEEVDLSGYDLRGATIKKAYKIKVK